MVPFFLIAVVFLLVHMSFIGISVALYLTGHDVLPLVFDDLPLELHNDDMFLRYQVSILLIMKKDSKRCCDATTPESIHTKDESKRGSAFAFIFGVN